VTEIIDSAFVVVSLRDVLKSIRSFSPSSTLISHHVSPAFSQFQRSKASKQPADDCALLVVTNHRLFIEL